MATWHLTPNPRPCASQAAVLMLTAAERLNRPLMATQWN